MMSLEEIVAEQLAEIYSFPIERVQDSASLIAEAIRRPVSESAAA